MIPWINKGVYFVERSDGLIKIGWTQDLRRRIPALGKRSARIQVLAIGEPAGDMWVPLYAVERRVHHEFRHLHVGHEWFRPAPELRAFAAQVARTGLIPERFCLSLHKWPQVPRLSNGPRKPRRGVHFTRRACLRRAQLMLTTAALIEHYRARKAVRP